MSKPSIAAIAREALATVRTKAAAARAQQATPDGFAGLGLMDFVPVLEPGHVKPTHFGGLVSAIELAVARVPQKKVVHGPPQHGKTSLLQAAIAWGLKKNPKLTFGYAAYGDKLAKSKSRRARAMAKLCGVKLENEAVGEWRTHEGGGLIATSVGGALTGNKVDVLFIDDAFKNRAEAESPAHRAKICEWFNDVADTRVHPDGSIFCFGARWHPEDLGGFLIKQHKFDYLKYAAIDDEGNALAPHLFTAEQLRRFMRNAITWASLYQGVPRLRGKTVFDPPAVYTEAPKVFHHAFGLDGAYSAKTSADYSAVVRLLRARVPDDDLPHFFLAYAHRDQVRMPQFRMQLKKLHDLYPGAVGWRWYIATTEAGGADLMGDGENAVPIHAMLAKADKYQRALPLAEAWNDGRVHVPADAPWLEELLAEVLSFTGLKDAHDDFVDALAAAFDLLNWTEADQHVDPLRPLKRTGVGAADM